MALPGWRVASEKILAEKVGAMAGLLMDECLGDLGLSEHDVTASHYMQVLRLLYDKLPASIDRRALCQQMQVAVLQAYGFGNSKK